MAKASFTIVKALKGAASALAKSNDYQWGHMGSCNCGFLAREVAHLKKHEIHSGALLRSGDWSEQLNDYCPDSGLPMDRLISKLLDVGFDIDDLRHLERLSDPLITQTFPGEHLKFNVREDVIRYVLRWADLVESSLPDNLEKTEVQQSLTELVA